MVCQKRGKDFDKTEKHIKDLESILKVKMMDTILIKEGFKPSKWVFTDLNGNV